MHEMALCTEVVDTVIGVAEEADAVSVDGVSMIIGEMRDIIIDMFDDFFHYLARGTIAEGAVVSYTTVPLLVKCRQCGSAFHPDVMKKDTILCPTCGAHDYTLHSGNEFLIESIDVTTRDEVVDAA